MLKRVLLLAAVLLLVLLIVFPAAAQPADWSAYLYDSGSQQLIRVYLDGTQQAYHPDLPSGAYLTQDTIDFTSDGNHAAYCALDANMNAALHLKDMTSGETKRFNFGAAQGCWVKYSTDDSQIAVGLVHHYAGDTAADPNVPPWELTILDANGLGLHEMNPSKDESLFDPTQTIMPDVRYFTGDLLVFAGIPWGTEGNASYPAYLWQLSDDTVHPVDRWWRGGWDNLAYTGELVWTQLDPNLPAAEPGGPLPQANVVKLTDDFGREYTIFAEPDWVLLGTKFISNGSQLAINELQGADPNTMPGSQPTRWIALNRDGTTSELAVTPGYSQMASAPDGYALLWSHDSSANPVFSLDYFNGQTRTTLWQQASNGSQWSLVWSAPVRTDSGLQPFQTIGS